MKLDESSLHMLTLSDEYFYNNAYGRTEHGSIILISEKYGKANDVQYAPYEERRMVRSVLSAENICIR